MLWGLAPHGLFIPLSYRTQDHLLRGGITLCELGPPTPNTVQENLPQTPSLMGACSH